MSARSVFNRFRWTTCMAAMLWSVLILPGLSWSSNSYEMLDAKECRKLVVKGDILSMADLVYRNERLSTGTILDALLLKGEREFIYEIDVLGVDGVMRTLYIDARDGRLLPDFYNGWFDADPSR